MMKKLWMSGLILALSMILAGAAPAADGKSPAGQSSAPAAAASGKGVSQEAGQAQPPATPPLKEATGEAATSAATPAGAPTAAPSTPASQPAPSAAAPAGGQTPAAPAEGQAPAAPATAAAPAATTGTETCTGRVVDAKTRDPIAGALVTLGDTQVRADQDGAFQVSGVGDLLKLRYPGYAARHITLGELAAAPGDIALTPMQVKGLYLTVYGAASKKIRGAALAALERNHMNALVIDVKGDRGFIPFKVNIPLAQEIGAQKTILIKDMPAFVARLKEKGLYLIARIVVFKDDPLAKAKPAWAVRSRGGGVFRDRERLRWVDPFRKEVWDYNIAIAKAAAAVGFDEVQFDYVRFPDSRKTGFSKPANQDSRTAAITGFLKAAHQALIPTNLMVAADIFGYVCWNTNDTDIGQKIKEVSEAVDVISPMLYPSGYQFGIPKYRNPVKHPYEIVYLSLKRAQERTGVNPLRFRPWIQAFRDYAFRGGDFREDRMRIQIKAADKFGASGWMFWNPRNIYPKGVFVPK